MCVSYSEKEKELRELLLATEKLHMNREIVSIPKPEYELHPDDEHELPLKEIKMEPDCEVKVETTSEFKHQLQPSPTVKPMTIGNESSVVLQIIKIVPKQQKKNNEPPKKEAIGVNANNVKIPTNYKNAVFNRNCRPKTFRAKKALIPDRFHNFDTNTLSSDQLKRYCVSCKKKIQ